MKRRIIFLMFSLLATHGFSKVNKYEIGNLVLDDIPAIPHAITEKLNAYQNIRSASFLDWLPRETGILITTRFGETHQLHAVEVPKGMRRQLTFFREPIGNAYVCPDVNNPCLLFTKDSAGNENAQIFKFDLKTSEYRLLTDGKYKFGSVVWSHKGDKYAFSSDMRNQKDFDAYIGTLQGKKSFVPLVEKAGYWYTVNWSFDDTRLLIKHYVSASESYFYIFNLSKKEMTQINPSAEKISYGDGSWTKNGKGIFLISDQFSDFQQLLYYDLETKKFEILTKAITWDITDFELAPSGDTIALVTNEDGFSKFYFLDLKTRKLSQAQLPSGVIHSLKYNPDGTQLAFVINAPKSPSDVYSLNLVNKKIIRWTYSEIGGLDYMSFVEPQLVHYPTFDSVAGKIRLIPAFYYQPKKFTPPYPVLIDCHGGPEDQDQPTFYSMAQYLANEMGIAIITPNVRGSSGYGKEYLMLDNGYKREDAVKDIGALLDWIAQQPEFDAKRIAITGGSYGGYMVLASMVNYSNRLRCGIDAWGISNFVTFLTNTSPYRQDLRRMEYGNERDPKMREFLEEISPLTNAGKIKKPMFIVQGLNDPRVPVSEAEQILAALRNHDVPVWYLLAKNEGHGLGKKANRDFYQKAMVLFLEKYLLK